MKKNKAPLTQPLSERELLWLDSFFKNLSQTNESCMNLEEVDGLFCALIINPVMAKPAEWMNTIFGKEQAFSSDEELEKVMMLLIRYWNQLSVRIENPITEKENFYLPLVIKRDETSDYKLGEQWAAGFHLGMDYCRNDWRLFAEDEKRALILAPFLLLELGHNPDKENSDITVEEREDLLSTIPATVQGLFYYWINKINNDKKESKPKIGRNDPCPCGSGKKYKKCCEGQVSATTH